MYAEAATLCSPVVATLGYSRTSYVAVGAEKMRQHYAPACVRPSIILAECPSTCYSTTRRLWSLSAMPMVPDVIVGTTR